MSTAKNTPIISDILEPLKMVFYQNFTQDRAQKTVIEGTDPASIVGYKDRVRILILFSTFMNSISALEKFWNVFHPSF